jgi:hypothetical protein
MKTYHICYLIGNELCSGINILAENYIHAIVEFQDRFKNKKIPYIKKRDLLLIRLLVELFFANRNTPKKKVFYFLKAKVFCGKVKTTVDRKSFNSFFGG